MRPPVISFVWIHACEFEVTLLYLYNDLLILRAYQPV